MGIRSTELVIILVIILVLFGGSQLPRLARSLGQAQREFKRGADESEQLAEPTRSKDERSGD